MHASTRAELGVKKAKRLLRDSMSSNGKLDNVAVTRALLTYKNTPDRDTGLAPTYMLLGGILRNSCPRSLQPSAHHLNSVETLIYPARSKTWLYNASWPWLRVWLEPERSCLPTSRSMHSWSLETVLGYRTRRGNKPLRWSK